MLQRGNRRRRRVSAISDYLESAKKGKIEGGSGSEESREKGVRRERGKKGKNEGELWIAGGSASNSSNCASDFLQSQHMAD